MIEAYYVTAFLLSVMLMLVYVFVYHRHYDVHMSVAFVLAPVSTFAQLLLSRCEDVQSALLANRILYVGGCYLILMIMLAIFSLCDIHLNRYIRFLFYLVTTIVFFCVQQMGTNDLYYKNVSLVREGGATVLMKEYGILHPVYYAMLVIYFLLGMGAIAYSYFKKNHVSKRFIGLLTLPEILCFTSFFASRKLSQTFAFFPDIELVPFAYDVAEIVYLIITHNLALYNISDTVIDSLVQKGGTGFLSFDFKFRYLGSNETARNIFPELNEQAVDKPIRTGSLTESVLKWLKDFAADNSRDQVYYKVGEKTYIARISFLYDGNMRRRGYQMYVIDDTKNQQYIALLDNYNTELKAEVAEKTANLVEMHDNLILSLAVMVDNRDNSTGGHIRRTSDGVRILVDEMKRGGEFELSEQFCSNIIKAAPMHDLGKITIDDAILRKPGRFTEEEFEIMKTHAAEGARIVHEILKGTEDEEFHRIAENVAHFHHERWDGGGYPDGLKGEEIPLEARIMAIIDVYDALVSKRVYKEEMPFEKANQIITESMGKQFDPRLEPYYRAARPKLEQYYTDFCENPG
jgi:putative two-component system response regulator